MAQQVDGHHRYGVSPTIFWQHVFHIGILCAEILAETQCLGFEPSFLQLYQYQVTRAIAFLDGGSEVDAEHGESVTPDVGVFVPSGLDCHYVLFQKCRQQGAGYTFVL